ncbi:Major facilitator superfamily domain-containing protein 8 [Chionoecetes opilio]|uniref:Major facilitator superfamily domain-containing protein 8 n=1 Tax=Chionoecetes opilio TaxID=41210 RepID=A0A8J4YH86_CHIOP|nr:Major facilitator superfamily domain-containing protein 8 [Chionoecetes opilio]
MGGTLGKGGSWVVDHAMDDMPLEPYGRDRVSHGSIITGFEGACLITVAFFILGNAMYSLLAVFEGLGSMATYYAMIISRFIVGVSSANVTLCRAYLAQATTLQERTSGIAIVAAAQALGFVIGPGIQTVLILLVPVEVDTGSGGSNGTSTQRRAGRQLSLGLSIWCCSCQASLRSTTSHRRKGKLLMRGRNGESMKLPTPDPWALAGLLFGFFITAFIYVLIETLAVPFVGDQYGWSGNTPQLVIGVAIMGGGILATCLFPVSGWLARKIDERLVMLIPGFIPILLGTALFMPYPGSTIPIQECYTNTSESTSPLTTWETSTWDSVNSSWEVSPTASDLILDDSLPPSDPVDILHRLLLLSDTAGETTDNCTGGCPIEQEWCQSVPQLPLAQLAVAFLIIMLGYPIAQSINQGIYSKVLGPRPQGLWMGVLTGVGGLARIAGPIFVAYIYTELGTYWCFGVLLAGMILAFCELIALYPRLVPMKLPTSKTQYAYDGPAAKPQPNGTDNPPPRQVIVKT